MLIEVINEARMKAQIKEGFEALTEEDTQIALPFDMNCILVAETMNIDEMTLIVSTRQTWQIIAAIRGSKDLLFSQIAVKF
ncbi:hypothetical protein QTP81_07140 [Alteromonas sp. ASW11-36]|uniref:Uncharacterized protein n=1 Tax=Alteromonas arenosi TaxID=3055817 RepID=A0ABT7SVZ3_9ALTE|nr:hypothetical protein [Alteromonas sp. ASW11-36]MDM7860366.1 hypothetical protein [Alteromonas sp. ASW11-36]